MDNILGESKVIWEGVRYTGGLQCTGREWDILCRREWDILEGSGVLCRRVWDGPKGTGVDQEG